MYFADLHTHSILSVDGFVPLAEMAWSAVDAGLSMLTITDHCDLLSEHGERRLTYDWAPGLKQFAETLPQFEGKLDLRLGLELGGAYVSPAHARAILAGAGEKLDFVIGSVHNDREDSGGVDYYHMQFTSSEQCCAALDGYFASMEELVGLADCYDVLGHIIYPLRYMVDRDGQAVSLDRWRDQIAHIFSSAISQGRGIELNTNRGRTIQPWKELLALYRDLGGEIVTTGTDAHQPQHVGLGIADAYDLLRECGFRYVAVYSRRKPDFISI